MGATLPAARCSPWPAPKRLAWGVTYLKATRATTSSKTAARRATGWQYRRGDQWARFRRARRHGPPQSGRSRTPGRLSQPTSRHAGWRSRRSISRAIIFSIRSGSATSPGPGGRSAHLARHSSKPTCSEAMDSPAMPAADAVLGLCRPRRAHRPARRRLVSAVGARGTNGLLPIPAWDPANHWRGRAAAERCPPQTTIRPRASWRRANGHDQPGGPLLVTQTVPAYRKRRIDERLRELKSGDDGRHAGAAIRRGEPASRRPSEIFCRN